MSEFIRALLFTGSTTGGTGATITVIGAAGGVAATTTADGAGGPHLNRGSNDAGAITRGGSTTPGGTDEVRIEKELPAENECIADFLNVRKTGPVPGPRRLTCRGGSMFKNLVTMTLRYLLLSHNTLISINEINH